MTRSRKPDHTFARAVRLLLNQAPGGPMSMSELARRAGVPRSTVHRHLKGGQPQRGTLEAYARALDVPLNHLLALFGYPVPRSEAFEDQVRGLATELADLEPDDLELVREILDAVRRRSQRVRPRDTGQHNDPPAQA